MLAYSVQGRFPDSQRLEDLVRFKDFSILYLVETVLPLARDSEALQLSESRRVRFKIVI